MADAGRAAKLEDSRWRRAQAITLALEGLSSPEIAAAHASRLSAPIGVVDQSTAPLASLKLRPGYPIVVYEQCTQRYPRRHLST